ncbi:hypothetical protein [Streptomyces sp. NPDC002386]
MRVHLSDGTHEIEIEADGRGAPTLHEIEQTAARLLDRLRTTPTTEPEPERKPFGFARRDQDGGSLDGVALDSSTERAEPYDDDRSDEYDEDDDT